MVQAANCISYVQISVDTQQVLHPPWDGRFLSGSVSRFKLRCHSSICNCQTPLNPASIGSFILKVHCFVAASSAVASTQHVHTPIFLSEIMSDKDGAAVSRSCLVCFAQALELYKCNSVHLVQFHWQLSCVACQDDPLPCPSHAGIALAAISQRLMLKLGHTALAHAHFVSTRVVIMAVTTGK